MAKNKLNKRQKAFLQAYKDNKAVLYDSLVEAGVTNSEYTKWRESNSLFAEECEMVELYAVSLVEKRMFDIISKEGYYDTKLMTFYLERRGGYNAAKETKKPKDDYEITFGK